jgi:hypothetical protein
VYFLKISEGCLVKSLLSSEFECADSRPELAAPPTVEQLTEVFLFSSYSDGPYLSVITFVPRQM